MIETARAIIELVLYANLLGIVLGGLFTILALLMRRRKAGAFTNNK